jgi:hypothetical protein
LRPTARGADRYYLVGFNADYGLAYRAVTLDTASRTQTATRLLEELPTAEL